MLHRFQKDMFRPRLACQGDGNTFPIEANNKNSAITGTLCSYFDRNGGHFSGHFHGIVESSWDLAKIKGDGIILTQVEKLESQLEEEQTMHAPTTGCGGQG